MTRLHVATLNLRNLADRWDERLPLLLNDFGALQPDVIGLQEVVFVLQQDRLLGAAGPGRYAASRAWAGRPEYGNSILTSEALAVAQPDRLELSHGRSAGRLRIAVDGTSVEFVNVHLHHEVPDDAVRDEQVRILLAWLDGAPSSDVQIVVGDFNADPGEPAYARMTAAGFRSACLEANGVEPAVTWPSGLQGPAIDTDGDPSCLDYIWLRGTAAVDSARVVFDRPAVGDQGLYPSDHFGLSAILRIGDAG